MRDFDGREGVQTGLSIFDQPCTGTSRAGQTAASTTAAINAEAEDRARSGARRVVRCVPSRPRRLEQLAAACLLIVRVGDSR